MKKLLYAHPLPGASSIWNMPDVRMFLVVLVVGSSFAAKAVGQNNLLNANQPLYGFDVLVGARASPVELTLNTIYPVGISAGDIPFSIYGRLLTGGNLNKYVQIAVPMVVGDSLDGRYPIVGTLPKFFGVDDSGKELSVDQVLNYRPGLKLEFAEGHCFAPNKFEAVVGSDIPRLTGKAIGATFQATHGIPIPGHKPDVHPPAWRVVAVLARTHTAIDRTLYIPLLSFYTVSEHAAGMVALETLRDGASIDQIGPAVAKYFEETPPSETADGVQHFSSYDYDTVHKTFKVTVSPEHWTLSAILVRSKGGIATVSLTYSINFSGEGIMAIDPESTSDALVRYFEEWIALGIIPARQSKAAIAGVPVAAMIADSPAALAGIKCGDILVQFDDQPLNNCLDLAGALTQAHPGDNLQLKVRRGERALMLDVKLGPFVTPTPAPP
jgi:hypothetical protein